MMASGLGRSSARDEWPPGEVANASAEAMPRWRWPTRQPVGSQTIARGQAARPLAGDERPGDGGVLLLVAREQHRHVARPPPGGLQVGQRLQDGGDGALGVGAAQAVQPAVPHRGGVGRGAVAGVGGDGVDVGVEQQRRRRAEQGQHGVVPADGEAVHAVGAQPRQHCGQVLGHGALVPHGVLCIERHQLRSAAGPDWHRTCHLHAGPERVPPPAMGLRGEAASATRYATPGAVRSTASWAPSQGSQTLPRRGSGGEAACAPTRLR